MYITQKVIVGLGEQATHNDLIFFSLILPSFFSRDRNLKKHAGKKQVGLKNIKGEKTHTRKDMGRKKPIWGIKSRPIYKGRRWRREGEKKTYKKKVGGSGEENDEIWLFSGCRGWWWGRFFYWSTGCKSRSYNNVSSWHFLKLVAKEGRNGPSWANIYSEFSSCSSSSSYKKVMYEWVSECVCV